MKKPNRKTWSHLKFSISLECIRLWGMENSTSRAGLYLTCAYLHVQTHFILTTVPGGYREIKEGIQRGKETYTKIHSYETTDLGFKPRHGTQGLCLLNSHYPIYRNRRDAHVPQKTLPVTWVSSVISAPREFVESRRNPEVSVFFFIII